LDSKNRGKGDASKLLDCICYIADKFGIELNLNSYASKWEDYGEGEYLTQEQLVSFYLRKGFEFENLNKESPFGKRKPRTPIHILDIPENVLKHVENLINSFQYEEEEIDY
jgi:hypothetical protein